METLDVARTIVDALADKKGENIVLLDITDVADFADYFVICSGTSERMLNALADSVKDIVKEKHRMNARVEGVTHGGWLLADYGDVVVHIFSSMQRDYYKLEELWSEGRILVHLQ